MGGSLCSKNTHQLSRRRDDQCPQPILRSPLPSIQDLQYGNEECERLAAACARCSKDVLALKRDWETLGLNVSHVNEE